MFSRVPMSGGLKKSHRWCNRMTRGLRLFGETCPQIVGSTATSHTLPRSYSKHSFAILNFRRHGIESFPSQATRNTHSAHISSIDDEASSGTVWTREALQAETNRLLELFAIKNSDPRAASGELSKVKLMDIDRMLEGWVHFAMHERNDGLHAASQAHAILRCLQGNFNQLDELKDDDRLDSGTIFDLVPDAATFNFVLQAYAVSRGGTQTAVDAESILSSMIERCRQFSPKTDNLLPVEPTTRSFNIVINAWAKTGSEVGAQRAEAVFTEMETWLVECSDANSPFQGAVPTARSLAAVIDALARSGVTGAEERAGLMLNHMINKRRDYLQGSTSRSPGTVIKVNRIVFNSAILAWVRSKRGQVAAENAEALLKQMELLDETKELGDVDEMDDDDVGLTPDTRTLSLVMDAWANCPSKEQTELAARRAAAILDRMESLYREGREVKPNCIAFTTCITAWSRCKTPDAAENAEKLLDRMLDLYKETDDIDFKPTSVSGNALIAAWANSNHPESAQRAETILKRLEEFCQPDLYSYNSLLHAYSRTGKVAEALDLLRRLEKEGSKREVNLPYPDTISYNSVIDALAKQGRKGNAIEAEALLNRMEEMTRSGRSGVAPDKVTYTSVINAFAKSMERNKADRAYATLARMIDGYEAGNKKLRPDAFACTACINACGRLVHKPEEKRKALQTAIRVFEQMKSSDDFEQPNELTFLAMMRACSNLALNRNEECRLLGDVFRQCCGRGLVSKQGLEHVQRRLPGNLKAQLGVGGEHAAVPEHWTANVRSWRHRP